MLLSQDGGPLCRDDIIQDLRNRDYIGEYIVPEMWAYVGMIFYRNYVIGIL